jgi:hypothetical protein
MKLSKIRKTYFLFLAFLIFSISSCNSTIGSTYDLGQFEVAENDFEDAMVWGDANDECKKLGEGWRLPTLSELNIMYQNKDKIGHLTKGVYWGCSSGYIGRGSFDGVGFSYYKRFDDGEQGELPNYSTFGVRAVRSKK